MAGIEQQNDEKSRPRDRLRGCHTGRSRLSTAPAPNRRTDPHGEVQNARRCCSPNPSFFPEQRAASRSAVSVRRCTTAQSGTGRRLTEDVARKQKGLESDVVDPGGSLPWLSSMLRRHCPPGQRPVNGSRNTSRIFRIDNLSALVIAVPLAPWQRIATTYGRRRRNGRRRTQRLLRLPRRPR